MCEMCQLLERELFHTVFTLIGQTVLNPVMLHCTHSGTPYGQKYVHPVSFPDVFPVCLLL